MGGYLYTSDWISAQTSGAGICRWRIYSSEWVDENDPSTGSRPPDSQNYEDIRITECQSITRGFTLSRFAIDWVPGIHAGINYLDIRRKDYAERRGGSRTFRMLNMCLV